MRAKEIISSEDLEIQVELGLGKESAKYWTCDFSYVSFPFLFGMHVFPAFPVFFLILPSDFVFLWL